MTNVDVKEARLPANGVTLKVAVAGPPNGPVVVLLHGFPETWYAWTRQIHALAAAGHRVLAPDLRGYGASDKPTGWAHYRIDVLVADVAALIAGTGSQAAAVVGHDWGGALAWTLAGLTPHRVRALVAMNLPHPRVFRRHLATDPAQWIASAYMAFFQLPSVPEWLLVRRRGKALVRALISSSRPGAFDDETLEGYRTAWTASGAMTAMLNWYRAAAKAPASGRIVDRIAQPTLILWGARDRFLRRVMADESLAFCANGRLEVWPDATHWLHHEQPERVSGALLGFLNETLPPAPPDRSPSLVPARHRA